MLYNRSQYFPSDNSRYNLKGTRQICPFAWCSEAYRMFEEDNLHIVEGEALTYDDEKLEKYENDSINFLEPNPKNRNHAIERDDHKYNIYDWLRLSELMLPNDSIEMGMSVNQ